MPRTPAPIAPAAPPVVVRIPVPAPDRTPGDVLAVLAVLVLVTFALAGGYAMGRGSPRTPVTLRCECPR